MTFRAFQVVHLVKNLPAMQETLGQFLGQEDPLEKDRLPTPVFLGFPGGSDGKESAGNMGDLGSIPGLGRSPGGGYGNPLQYSCLGNPVDRWARRATQLSRHKWGPQPPWQPEQFLFVWTSKPLHWAPSLYAREALGMRGVCNILLNSCIWKAKIYVSASQ